MKAPLSWLREYVTITLPPEELASRLALTGTEVERVTYVGVPGGEDVVERFVVGKVLTCERHPDADKLSVCTVDVDEEDPRTIVCGAPNVAAGQTVAVSLPGAVLPGGLSIKEAKLRGVRSSGMILSEAELGFEAKSAGTMVLPDSWEAGAFLADYLPLDEWILEVEVTPNRPDCLSIRGLAREIAAITGEPFDEEFAPAYPVTDRHVDEDITVEVWDPDLCPRYAARVIRGVTIAESPAWLKARITHAGMRPVNNVVDVTNYVMWTVGQPLHAFDLDTVAERRIIARRATGDEPITTLDGTARVLSPDMLVIADAGKPSVIAGIMGSMDSEVTDETTDILLEAANFHGPSIMRTSMALGLRSESSTRFEKGLDPNLVVSGLDLACRLLVDVCGGTVSQGTADVAAVTVSPWGLRLRPERVEHVLGENMLTSDMESILGALGCDVCDREGELWVTVPTFRRDLEREIDLVEEIARVHGLGRLPSTLPSRREGRGGLTREQQLVRRAQDTLKGAGLSEVITYSFAEPGWLDRVRLEESDPRRNQVMLTNPLSQDQSVLRTMLLPALLATAARNVSVREERVPLFEIGSTFHLRPQHGDGDRVAPGAPGAHDPRGVERLPEEVLTLGILVHGEWHVPSWTVAAVPVDYFLVKGLVERLAAVLREDVRCVRASEPFLHPGRGALVEFHGESVGWLGEVHPLVTRAFDLPGPVVGAELDLRTILHAAPDATLFEDLLTYPAVQQDLALVVERNLPAASVLDAIRAQGGDLLWDVQLFDVYEGPQVGGGKKSLALRLTYRSAERTLEEAEVNRAREDLLTSLAASLGATLRG